MHPASVVARADGVNAKVPTIRAIRLPQQPVYGRAVGRGSIALVLGAVLGLTACGGISTTELEEEARARGGGLGETLVFEALEAVEEDVGADLVLTGLTLNRESVSMSILVPGSDSDLDSYIYQSNGNLVGPDPVNGDFSAVDVEPTLMAPGDLALDELDEVVDDALEQADLTDGYAQTLHIGRSAGQQPRITVSLASPRRNATLQYRADGTRIEQAP
jgi:hypothetical protein